MRRSTFAGLIILLAATIFCAALLCGHLLNAPFVTLMCSIGNSGVAQWLVDHTRWLAQLEPLGRWLTAKHWPGISGFWIVFIGMTLAIVLLENARSRRRRRRWGRDRSPMDDAEFVAALSLSGEEARTAGALRRAFAVAFGVPAQAIHPQDSLQALNRLTLDGIDRIEVVFPLEKELHARIPVQVVWEDPFEGMAKDRMPTQMGDLIAAMARCVAAHLEKSREDGAAKTE